MIESVEELTNFLRIAIPLARREWENASELPREETEDADWQNVTLAADTVQVGMIRSFFVVSVPDGATLTLNATTSRGKPLPAITLKRGSYYSGKKIYNASFTCTGAATVTVSRYDSLPTRGYGEQGARSYLAKISNPSPISGAAIAGNVVTTLLAPTTYSYMRCKLKYLSLELDTDATAANRIPVIDLYAGDAGNTIEQTMGGDIVTANQLGHFYASNSAGTQFNLETGRLTMSLTAHQEVECVAGVALARVTIGAGVAGDTYKVMAAYEITELSV